MQIKDNNELKNNLINEILSAQSSMKPQKQEENESFKELMEISQAEVMDGIIPLVMPQMPEFETIEAYDIDTKAIENVDAMFFLNIANQGESLNIQMKDNLNVIDASNYKTMEVSKTLGDILLKSMENNKSVRLDFDNHVTVVLKVSSEGKIDASFIPQNKEVENYLKNNIDYLKVRFDEQAIAYSNISYKPYKQNKKQGDKRNE